MLKNYVLTVLCPKEMVAPLILLNAQTEKQPLIRLENVLVQQVNAKMVLFLQLPVVLLCVQTDQKLPAQDALLCNKNASMDLYQLKKDALKLVQAVYCSLLMDVHKLFQNAVTVLIQQLTDAQSDVLMALFQLQLVVANLFH